MKFYIWNIALCGSENWTLKKVNTLNFWNVFLEMAWDELDWLCEEWRKANWIGHILCSNCLLEHIIEEYRSDRRMKKMQAATG